MDTPEIERFSKSLTMREIALFEEAIGKEFSADDIQTREVMNGLALISTHRLGHPLTLEEVETLTAEEIVTVITRAATAPAPERSGAVTQLLAALDASAIPEG